MHIQLDAIYDIEKRLTDIPCNRFSFEDLWSLHPDTFHYIHIHGKYLASPRWQRAYLPDANEGSGYRFSGTTLEGHPISPLFTPYLKWCRDHVDPRLNGLLVNWYDGASKHYIGKHRDDTRDLVEGSPIVTISLGAPRTFRMRPHKGQGFIDTTVNHGDVLVIPSITNKHWTHEVPHFKRDVGRRISITCRAYLPQAGEESTTMKG